MKKRTERRYRGERIIGTFNGKKIQAVSVERLLIDFNYQRPRLPAHVQNIASSFTNDGLNTFKLGRRKNGTYFVTDGQQRLMAIKYLLDLQEAVTDGTLTIVPVELERLKEAGEEIPKLVLCLVDYNSTMEKEAESFVLLNTNRPVTGNARFMANLSRRHQPETLISKWVQEEGFKIDFLPSGRPSVATIQGNGIRAAQELLNCYNRQPTYLKPALRFLRLACGYQGHKYAANCVPYDLRTGQVVRCIAMMLKNHGTKSSTMISELAKVYRNRGYDMSAKWSELRGYGGKRHKLMVEWLAGSVGNGPNNAETFTLRKAA